MTRPVFLAEPAELADVRAGGVAHVRGPEAHHAASVRRIRSGEEVDVVDGRGRRVTGAVTDAAKDRLTVSVTTVVDEPAPTPRLVLVQALGKGGRDEQAVESATELGVDRVVPWQAERCVSRWDAKADKGRARWTSVAEGAAKQSRRARVPAVDAVVTTASLADAVARATGAGAAEASGPGGTAGHGAGAPGAAGSGATVLVLHESATERLAALLAAGAVAPGPAAPEVPVRPAAVAPGPAAPEVPVQHAAAAPGEVWCVVGPEGGISDAELDALVAAGAVPVRLGPHVLRTSSAGPAALAALGAALGRW
ncbi:RsmE family RNA methyltransferase [Georgenia sp. Z1491]|uniref:RsmE family RNA methyltransferase n=1 Tax=Georgenia sp. Z1491 TaxID=3416707 RepID=UPI003CF321C9